MKAEKRLSPHLQALERIFRNNPSANLQESEPIAGPSGATRNTQMLPPWPLYTQPKYFNNQDLVSDQSVLSFGNMMSNDYAPIQFTNEQVQQIDDTYNAMQVSGNADTSMQSIAGGEDFTQYLNKHAQQQTVPDLALPQFSVFIDRVNGQNRYVPKD